jgi:CBS domain-containing protein
MGSPWIQPSPALRVTSHTPIADCVRLMREKNVGSLLVYSQKNPDDLVGIFTERDLLKWIDEIQHGGHWNKPVAHLMSGPVVTLPFDRIDDAAEVMLKKGIRHLPITDSETGQNQRMLGVISMRDLFARSLEQLKKISSQTSRKSQKKRILFLGDGSEPRAFQFNSLSRWIRSHWNGSRCVTQTLTNQPLQPEDYDSIEASDLLILDLDGLEDSIWSGFLKEINRRSEAPPVLLLLTEEQHPERTRNLLKSLAQGGKWPAFAKPIPLMDLMDSVQNSLA